MNGQTGHQNPVNFSDIRIVKPAWLKSCVPGKNTGTTYNRGLPVEKEDYYKFYDFSKKDF